MIKIENAELNYHVDYVNKTIHLLDLDQHGRKSLTNIIDPNFQKKLIEQEGLLEDVIEFDWLCYPSDGVVYQYVDYGFQFVANESPILFNHYVEVMKERRNRH